MFIMITIMIFFKYFFMIMIFMIIIYIVVVKLQNTAVVPTSTLELLKLLELLNP